MREGGWALLAENLEHRHAAWWGRGVLARKQVGLFAEEEEEAMTARLADTRVLVISSPPERRVSCADPAVKPAPKG